MLIASSRAPIPADLPIFLPTGRAVDIAAMTD
jgi:hypothetical protein